MRSLNASWYIATEREAVLLANLDRTRDLADWLRVRAEEGEVAGVAGACSQRFLRSVETPRQVA